MRPLPTPPPELTGSFAPSAIPTMPYKPRPDSRRQNRFKKARKSFKKKASGRNRDAQHHHFGNLWKGATPFTEMGSDSNCKFRPTLVHYHDQESSRKYR